MRLSIRIDDDARAALDRVAEGWRSVARDVVDEGAHMTWGIATSRAPVHSGMLKAHGIGEYRGENGDSAWAGVTYLTLPREGSRPSAYGLFVERGEHPGRGGMRSTAMIQAGWSVVAPGFESRVKMAVDEMISRAGLG